MSSPDDTHEVTEFESHTSQDVITARDVVYSLSFRAEQIDNPRKGGSTDLSSEDQKKVAELDAANEWLSRYLKENSSATVQEAYQAAMQQEMPEPGEETKQWQAARHLLGGYVLRENALSKLDEAEQAHIIKAREDWRRREQKQVTPEEKEIEILSEFGEKAKFVVCTSVEREDGKKGYDFFTAGLGKETARLLVTNQAKPYFLAEDAVLGELEVTEAVTIHPNGKDQVEIIYRTTGYGNQWLSDEYNRRGSSFVWAAQLPQALGEKIASRVKEDPGFIRTLIVSSVKVDLQGRTNYDGSKIRFKSVVGVAGEDLTKEGPEYYNGGIPPYHMPEWQGSNMYVSIKPLDGSEDIDYLDGATKPETKAEAAKKVVRIPNSQ